MEKELPETLNIKRQKYKEEDEIIEADLTKDENWL